MDQNHLIELEKLGQSIWLDYLKRGSIDNGDFARWIKQDGITGLTSNPSIFEKAIAGSHDYDQSILALSKEGKSAEEIYQALTIEDIQRAADIFHPIYDHLAGSDGFVSLEVSPYLAHDTAGTIAEARQLWAAVNRPNLFIKVPATKEGLPAIRDLIGMGINVNITLLFGLPRYREVADAYLSGLEILSSAGKPMQSVASVASFFLSRIDVLIDPMLEKLIQAGGPLEQRAQTIHGMTAIASAKVAYQMFMQIFGSKRFLELAGKGARVQRVLWASTSTKDPRESDVKYVDALIGPDTINTLPIETLDAFRDHGKAERWLDVSVPAAYRMLENLKGLGIDIDAVTQQLEDEGVEKFIKAYDQLLVVLREKMAAA